MGGGCVDEVDLFLAFRHELTDERSAAVLRHVADCQLCHDVWRRFGADEQVAEGIQCALRGDPEGADRTPAWGDEDDLPEELEIPGFNIRPGYIDGGQARVYRGTYEASQEEVAIKVFYNSTLNEGGRERFAREIKSLARLRHPNVITIRSDGQIDGHAYFVMPWIESLTLDEYISQTPLTFSHRVGLISKICDAVSHAHRRGVMHLDLKPTNVRVDSAGEPIVMDFGLAKLSEAEMAEPIGLPGVIAGTPLYMAPEQLEGDADLDVRADVYSLGLLLYEVLAGRRAKGGDLTRSQASARSATLAREVPPPLRAIDPLIPGELEAITLRAIEVDRDRRYQTAHSLYVDLQNYDRGLMVQAKAHERLYRLRKWAHVYREILAAAGLVALIMGFAVAIRWRLNRVTLEQTRYVENVWRESNEAAVQRGQEQGFLLNAVRRDLIQALEEVELLAGMQGDWSLAEASHDQAAGLRRKLGETVSLDVTSLDNTPQPEAGDMTNPETEENEGNGSND